ncbi:uncharacterized protein OCT59_023190 [Rhizophagus irregularis]|uniref:uncharacterized protein n=1 Tax=Rhizophagus irregularis TaxID=588596 RepID=UPI00332D6EED|nr:hypothetical protein OCT59_023190 [Rhizophagus irregularis]
MLRDLITSSINSILIRYLYAPLRPIQRIYHGSRVLVKVSLPPIMNNVNGWAIGKKKIARAKSIPPGS